MELLVDGARYGDADDVQRALEAKVDVNAQDEWGKTGGSRLPARGCGSLQGTLERAVNSACLHMLEGWRQPRPLGAAALS